MYGEGVFRQRPSVVSLRCVGAGFESTLCPRLPAVPLPLLCLWSLPCAVLICHALLWQGPVRRCPQAHCRRSGVCVCLQLRGGGVARELSLGCRSPWGECLSLFSRLSGAPPGAEGSPSRGLTASLLLPCGPGLPQGDSPDLWGIELLPRSQRKGSGTGRALAAPCSSRTEGRVT